MNDELELYDTTVFNETLEALDTGKTVYLYYEMTALYCSITSFGLAIVDNSHLIYLKTDEGAKLTIYPFEGYNVSDLYTPTNLIISEDDSSEVPSVT